MRRGRALVGSLIAAAPPRPPPAPPPPPPPSLSLLPRSFAPPVAHTRVFSSARSTRRPTSLERNVKRAGRAPRSPRYFMPLLRKAASLDDVNEAFDAIELADLRVDVFHISAAMSALNTRHRPADAVSLFEDAFARYNVQPNLVSYNTLLHAIALSSRQKDLAVPYLRQMIDRGIVPDAASYATCIATLEKSA